MNKEIIVNSRKYDGSLHRSWNCELVSFDGEHLVLRGEFDRDVEHEGLGLILAGTITIEHFWLSKWHNVFRFESHEGVLRNHYVNVSMPPTFDGKTLEFVDLDLDVVIWPNGEYVVLDEMEFANNSIKLEYPDEVDARCLASLKEISSKSFVSTYTA